MFIHVKKLIKKELISLDFESRDEYIIKKYQRDEETMIRLFAEWCLNHQLDAFSLYQRAYPDQTRNKALEQAVEEAGSEKLEIGNETMLEVLQMFGNDDLAFVAAEEIEKMDRK